MVKKKEGYNMNGLVPLAWGNKKIKDEEMI